MKLHRQVLAVVLSSLLVLVTAQAEVSGSVSQSGGSPAVAPTTLSAEQLQQLVAPIALYPDALVAQVLAGATYPAQIVEADRWLQGHSDLKEEALAKKVDKQSWDPSVKALVQFPEVLQNMDKNLSWTSSLGDAYANQEQDVTDAVQTMRREAQTTGRLDNNDQQKVTSNGNTIVIEPANPDVVYVPAYDPWLVYGGPIVAYPGWVAVPGIYFGGPAISFGVGFGIGFFAGFGWGWGHWGCDWYGHRVVFNHVTYVSHSRTIINRGHFAGGRGSFARGGGFHGDRSFGRQGPAGGHANIHPQPGMHSGAFSGFDHGGNVHGFSARGRASFGGGFHGGGRR